ncbi:MAG: signal peptidase I [Legionellales bacterium RIFCSPHIGHO2_12_FULL_37_14]|nr:MAG: signal peptidase I [Legionellales bacterium RIFCSPHIGHO2_12_FULL_37_14]
MNFALILLVLTIVTGFVYLCDIMYFKNKRGAAAPGFIIEQSRAFFPVFFTVLLLRSFLIEPFRIPSGSLEPTLRVGDFVAVNKFAYGLRLPVSEQLILANGLPKLGDIAVFRWPPNPKFDYIKRVIGLPGSVVEYHNKVLTIDGVVANQKFISYTTDESSGQVVAEYEETLGNIRHRIYIRPDVPAHDFKITVPPHQYFMLGDNRDDSADSRFWGFVDFQYLRGKAFLVWMSFDSKTYSIRWSRIGKMVN